MADRNIPSKDVTPDEMTPAQLCESLRTNHCVGDAVERCGICGPCVAAEMIERLNNADGTTCRPGEFLCERLRDCEASLAIFDHAGVSEYWLRHPGTLQPFERHGSPEKTAQDPRCPKCQSTAPKHWMGCPDCGYEWDSSTGTTPDHLPEVRKGMDACERGEDSATTQGTRLGLNLGSLSFSTRIPILRAAPVRANNEKERRNVESTCSGGRSRRHLCGHCAG
jgi:hypothetical protein